MEVLANSGQIKEALEVAEKAAAARQTLYRHHHPFNLDIYYIQGILLHYDGRPNEAERMLRQSLSTQDRDPYPDECRARCFYALSEVLKELGKEEEANQYRDQAFQLLNQWRDLFVIDTSDKTHPPVLFDHVVPLKSTRLSKYGKLWVGEKE